MINARSFLLGLSLLLMSVATAAAQVGCAPMTPCGGSSGSSFTAGQIPGTTTNDNASAGNVGEEPNCSVASGSAITLTSLSPVDLCSITLTAGDWDVRANFTFNGGGSVSTLIQYIGSISTTLNTLDLSNGRAVSNFVGGSSGLDIGSSSVSGPIGPVRFSVANGNTATIHFVGRVSSSGNAVKMYGIGDARRAR